MHDKQSFIEPLFERVEEYAKTSCELIKLKTLHKTTEVSSVAVSRGFAMSVFFMFIILTSIGLALWLGELLGKMYYGFFCVAGFYGIVGIVLYVFMHNWMKKRVSNLIVSKLFN